MLPTKLRSERCASDLNHFQLKVPSGAFSIAEILSAGNSTEFSKVDNSKTIQRRATNLTSLDSLGSCESIYVYFKPIKLKKT